MTRAKEFHEDYVLHTLTDVPTVNYTREQNSEAWRNLLSAHDYVCREHVLGKLKIASSETNRLYVFGLAAKDKPDVLVSSVELLIRESWHFHKTSSGAVERKSVLSGCVGGVFTYPEYRGKGLATIMIDKLLEVAKQPEFLGPEGFIFLYSEVGEYYARNGFKSFAVPLLKFPLSSSDSEYVPTENVELVRYHDFDKLFRQYNEHFDGEMRAKVAADGIDRITVDPTSQYIDWFHLRVKYFSTKLFGDTGLKFDVYNDSYEELVEKFATIEPYYFGLKITCPKSGDLQGFIVWQYEYDFDHEKKQFKNYATVIKIFVNTPKFDKDATQLALIANMKKYLEAKHLAPQMSNFEKIVIWESEISEAVAGSLISKYSGEHGLENSSRSAIRCIDPEHDQRLKSGDIIWENNNKLPWF